ncbi:MAG: hypothetical protein JXQ72_12510 [Anaerolineae bacterium]|nr:hypothetical protein [Anaerolineae bacterium]
MTTGQSKSENSKPVVAPAKMDSGETAFPEPTAWALNWDGAALHAAGQRGASAPKPPAKHS